jgi:hypothetical protein
MQYRDQVVDVVVEIEAALRHRDHARVHPFGEEHVVIGQKAFDRAAQQRRVMPRHRRNDEQARLRAARRVLEGALEMQEPAERPLPNGGDMYRDVLAADHGRADVPFRLAVAPSRALEQFQARGHGLAEGGVRQGVGRIAIEEPRRVGEGARGIERGLAHFIKPVRRRRVHRAIITRCGRRAAEFTNRHVPGPQRRLPHCSILSRICHTVNIRGALSTPLYLDT